MTELKRIEFKTLPTMLFGPLARFSSPHRSLIVLPSRATACRLRPFDLDNDTGGTYLHA